MSLLIRMLKVLFCFSLFAQGVLQGQSLIALEYWDFNDVAGKSFSNAAFPNGMVNSGNNATYWNNGGTGGTMQTDGNGHFVISGRNGQTNRKLPNDPGYSNPYNSGKYRLEMNLAEWGLDNTTAGAMGMELVDANNVRVLSMTLGVDTNDSSKGKIQFAGISDSSTRQDKLAYGNKEVGLSNTGAFAIAIEFDFDNDTLKFFANGETVRSITDFNATEFSQLKFFTNNPWSTNSTVSLDSMGLLQVPEPATYALMLGLSVLAMLGLKRRGFRR